MGEKPKTDQNAWKSLGRLRSNYEEEEDEEGEGTEERGEEGEESRRGVNWPLISIQCSG